jgi:subtilisin family serine protease
LIGPAFAASFILAKTENTDSETPVEEDNWAAAAEWAESLGADVISSSLGYLSFDKPRARATLRADDGQTAISTRAANLAAERGVVVVNSAGNSGFDPRTTRWEPGGRDRRDLGGRGFASSGRGSRSAPWAQRGRPHQARRGRQGRRGEGGLATGTSFYLASSRNVRFSCPLTAGVVALVLQAHPGLHARAGGGRAALHRQSAATPDNLLGYGIVDALAAVQAPEPAPDAPARAVRYTYRFEFADGREKEFLVVLDHHTLAVSSKRPRAARGGRGSSITSAALPALAGGAPLLSSGLQPDRRESSTSRTTRRSRTCWWRSCAQTTASTARPPTCNRGSAP